jgi:hypothetical protein
MGAFGVGVGIADPVPFGMQVEGTAEAKASSMNRLVGLTGLGVRRLWNFVFKTFGLWLRKVVPSGMAWDWWLVHPSLKGFCTASSSAESAKEYLQTAVGRSRIRGVGCFWFRPRNVRRNPLGP